MKSVTSSAASYCTGRQEQSTEQQDQRWCATGHQEQSAGRRSTRLHARLGESLRAILRFQDIHNALISHHPLLFLFTHQLPAWLRLQPQTTLLFLFFEQYKGLVDQYRAKQAH